jgi:hypothetical protein
MPQIRIMQNGSSWYWEVITQDREVIARGAAETHAQARVDSERAVSRRVPVSMVGMNDNRVFSASGHDGPGRRQNSDAA